jgi:hypothetical protein
MGWFGPIWFRLELILFDWFGLIWIVYISVWIAYGSVCFGVDCLWFGLFLFGLVIV